MTEQYKDLYDKAKELSELIRESDITKKYEKSIGKMKNDLKAQELLARLVMLGRDLNEKALKGEKPEIESNAEAEILRKELDDSPIVKEHTLVQKDYLQMFQTVMDRIRNPVIH